MMFAIPPNNYSQREAMQRELDVERRLLGVRIKAFNSPREVAAYLEEIGFRRKRPITEDTIKRWMREREFPFINVFGKRASFFTTSAHVFAWLWTMSARPLTPVGTAKIPKTPNEAPL